jgi:hypothetical protein
MIGAAIYRRERTGAFGPVTGSGIQARVEKCRYG